MARTSRFHASREIQRRAPPPDDPRWHEHCVRCAAPGAAVRPGCGTPSARRRPARACRSAPGPRRPAASGSSVGTEQMYSCSADSGVMPRASSASCSLPKSLKAQRITSCGSPFSPVLSPISSRPWSMRSSSSSSWSLTRGGIEAEHAHFLEQEADAAGGAEIAAVLGEDVAHAADGAGRVVGGGFDQQGHAVRRVALVEDLLVIGRLLARGAPDRRVGLVLRHVDGARVLQHAPQRRVRGRIRARRHAPRWRCPWLSG